MIRPATRLPALAVAALLATLALVAASRAGAEDRVAAAVARLRSASDFRVRTQAALSLGTSKDRRAVTPLCGGLEDISATVRAASAAALGRLALGGAECLKERLEEEKSSSVRVTIEKAIARIESGGAPVITESTKYYVAIGETTDKTGRGGSGVHDIVRRAMIQAAGSLGGFAIAPEGETPDDAQELLAKHAGLKAFFLWPKVREPVYAGGNLTMRVELSIFTYPGKALKGAIPLKLTMPDVEPGDTDSEDQLIEMAAARAFEKFSSHAARID